MATETFHFPGSSWLVAGEYDDEAQELTLSFVSGYSSLHRRVPQGIVEGLKASGSAGRYFNAHIKTAYPGTDA